MPTRKIATLSLCRSPTHNPPSMMYYEPGLYEHTCPACGRTVEFMVNGYWS